MDPRYFNTIEVTIVQVEVMELTPEEMEMIKKQRAKRLEKVNLLNSLKF